MTDQAGGRGWGRVLGLSLVCILLSAVQPALLVFVPFSLLVIALPPRRPIAVAVAAILLVTAFAGTRPQGLAAVERAWALLVGGWFVLAVVLLPRVGLVTRGLAAVGAAFGSAIGYLWLRGRALGSVDAAFTDRIRNSASTVADAWARQGGERFGPELAEAIRAAVELQATLYPALLALASLAGLAVAWWAWGRLALRPGGGLKPLREFRFGDGLIWLLILGLVLVLLPQMPEATRAGSNLLAFTGALFALRGVAVLLFFVGMPGPIGLLLAVLAGVLLYPIVAATTFLVGLVDTWWDIRSRRPASPDPET